MKFNTGWIIFAGVIFFIALAIIYVHEKTGIFYKIVYTDIVDHYAKVSNVDPLLIGAMVRKESSVNSEAVSRKGAIGLMQLMPPTAKELAQDLKIRNWSDEKLKNPEANVMLGTYYLQKLLKRYDNDLIMALGAYNAGIGNIDVVRFLKSGQEVEISDLPFKETRDYVRSILFTYRIYKFMDSIKKLPRVIYTELRDAA
ncbi:MAG: lytic transglycosylase domain-containing protein [Elusimicrobiota bacterium]|jgi:soluble lytic murein transglycosylase|nr:lytic transglycosylase domain-containing protein [Elusimicrobiota bacterium]